MIIVYKLSKIQQNHLKKQILTIIDWKVARVTQKSQVIYKTRHSRRILQDTHQKNEE